MATPAKEMEKEKEWASPGIDGPVFSLMAHSFNVDALIRAVSTTRHNL
jgi:hypothetical protein